MITVDIIKVEKISNLHMTVIVHGEDDIESIERDLDTITTIIKNEGYTSTVVKGYNLIISILNKIKNT